LIKLDALTEQREWQASSDIGSSSRYSPSKAGRQCIVDVGLLNYYGFIMLLFTRALIDRLISRESSASHDLVGDQAAHPVCDH